MLRSVFIREGLVYELWPCPMRRLQLAVATRPKRGGKQTRPEEAGGASAEGVSSWFLPFTSVLGA